MTSVGRAILPLLLASCVASAPAPSDGGTDSTLDHPDEILPATRSREELLEGGEGVDIRRIQRQNLVVGLGRPVDVTESVVDQRNSQPVVPRQHRVGQALGKLSVECDEFVLRSRRLGDSLDFVACVGK